MSDTFLPSAGGYANGGIVDPNDPTNGVPVAPADQGPLADASMPEYTPGMSQGGADKRVMIRNRTSLYRTGAFPSWFDDAYTADGLRSAIGKMTEAEVIQLKQRLWMGGYYDKAAGNTSPESMRNGGIPTTGLWGADDDAALTTLAAEAVSTGSDLDSALSQAMDSNRDVARDAAVDAYDLPGAVNFFQKAANAELGRDLTDAEVEELLQSYTGAQPAGPARTPGEVMTMANGDDTMTGPDGSIQVAPRTLTGGGPDSTAIQFGKSLAASFGLSVVQDFTPEGQAPDPAYSDGRGFSIAGSRQNLDRLQQWAAENTGEGKLFEKAELRFDRPGDDQNPTSISMVVNQGATRPNMSVNALDVDDTGRFLEAIRRPGPTEAAYNWEGEGSHRRGAYGISDQIWSYYANRLGIDQDDHSRAAQDKVAAVYAQEKFKEYGSWEDVATAFRKNDTEARKRADYRRYGAGSVDDFDTSDDDWVRQAIDDMGNISWNRQWGGAARGTDTFSQMFGNGAIPYTDYTDAIRSNDPRWQQQRLYSVWKRQMQGKVLANQLNLMLADFGGSKVLSKSDYQ